MCNLYTFKGDPFGWAKAHEAFLGRVLQLPAGAAEGVSNIDLSWKPQIYPDYRAPIVRRVEGQDEAQFARWGMPKPQNVIFQATAKRADKLRAKGKEVDFDELMRNEPNDGVTNIRNLESRHWKPWTAVENRCLVPMTIFSEPDQVGGSKRPIWFGPSDDRPLAYFAGITTTWTGVRKIREGRVTCDLYGFVTTDPHPLVAQYHEKATPLILATPEAVETWLTAPWSEAKTLQRPLPEGALKIVPAPERAEATP